MSVRRFRRSVQISESHCGPAVIQMLLDAFDVSVTQNQISKAAGTQQTINDKGTRIDQLALATTILAPHLSFWYKYRSTLDDIRYVLGRGFAVAVEWQGVFWETLEKQRQHDDGDSGHYSIISHIDDHRQVLIIVDPYKDFADQDRIMNQRDFVERWWDINEVEDEFFGTTEIQRDDQLLFFIAPENEEFPYEAGFKKFIAI